LSLPSIWRELLIGLICLMAVIAVFSFPAIPQDPAYHDFADHRMLFGIPNFWNVASNAAFLAVGIFGLLKFSRGAVPGAGLAYLAFCLGIILVSLGSAYYHLDPTPQSLVWDRLPMTLAFMAIFSMVVSDRVSEKLGARLLWPLALLGVASVTYWYWTEVQGRGDLRPYVIVQFLPMLIIPMLLLLYSGNRMLTAFLWATLLTYALAKVAEYFDPAIFAWLGFWSGHTVKHLLSALAVLWVVLCFRPAHSGAKSRI
jgi:hypothetical protein